MQDILEKSSVRLCIIAFCLLEAIFSYYLLDQSSNLASSSGGYYTAIYEYNKDLAYVLYYAWQFLPTTIILVGLMYMRVISEVKKIPLIILVVSFYAAYPIFPDISVVEIEKVKFGQIIELFLRSLALLLFLSIEFCSRPHASE